MTADHGASEIRLDGILETALFVDDLVRATGFYEGLLGLERLFGDERLIALDTGRRGVLLLFRRGTTRETAHLPGGTIPPHDGHGPAHIAFALPASGLPTLEAKLKASAIAIEGRTTWPRGGDSLYVRDPDGHLVEFATPGLWAIY